MPEQSLRRAGQSSISSEVSTTSVTESKAKTPSKTSKKAVKPAEAAALKAALEAAQIELVPLSALVKSPLNVRTIPYPAESVREMADSILAVGLIQNLVVHSLPDGLSGVAAGGRRLAALQLLLSEQRIDAGYLVVVKRVSDDLVVVASMVENNQRAAMHPAEQISGFRTLSEQGKSPVQIGDLLGYSPRHVQRMLKLADLAPVILDALAEDRITTEHCQALALENDTARQVQVFEAACQAAWHGKPDVQAIRRMITESDVAVKNNMKFRFVGAEAFSPDELRTDLFSDGEGGYVDRVALDTALLEKLQTVAEALQEAEGWAWCAGRMEPVGTCGDDAGTYRILPQPEAVLNGTERHHMDELTARYDALESHCDESVLLEAEMAMTECIAAVRAWTPEMRAKSGVVVSWRFGDVCVQRGVMLRESCETEEDPVQTPVYKRQPDPVDDISLPLLTKMCAERTLAVQAALMQQPDKSLALLAWTLCLTVFGSGAYSRPAQISLDCKHYSLTNSAPSGKEGTAYLALMQEGKRLEKLLPEGWKQDFTTFFTLSSTDLLALLSFCTACSLDGMQTRGTGGTSRSPLDALETSLAFHLRDWWQPTKENFFGSLRKPQIIAALNEAGLTGAARDAEKMKKGDAAEHAEHHMKDTRWVPVWMCAPQPQAEPESPEHPNNLADAA
ncbi:ParB/RepB/Spo0J family partition protein [Salmonella enterica]|nr:ParB/RepB/Spo0J family partition protein [Salmonella enterica]EBP2212688.1 ParB/RepB/Spo0J family partition protein [Salmonella enterica]EBP7109928.1 ParB/RepB/Spo0J family partition protein [Salmonella enterica]